MIDTKHTLDRAGSELLDAAMQIEGIGAALTAIAADLDGPRQVNNLRTARALEMLVGVCEAVNHRLGIAHDMIEDLAAEGEQEGVGNG